MAQRTRHDPFKNLVGFVVGDVHYALPVARVREIVGTLPFVGLPWAPSSVVGVADVRGEVVPVVDLRARFGLAPSGLPARRAKWIVVDVGERRVAVIVDAVTEVFGTGSAELRPPPTLGGGEDVRGLLGVASHGGHMVFVLDTVRLRELTEPLVAAGALNAPALDSSALPPRGGTP